MNVEQETTSRYPSKQEQPLYTEDVQKLYTRGENIINSAQNIDPSKLFNLGIEIFNQGHLTRVIEVKDKAVMDGKTVDLGRSRKDSLCIQLSISSSENKKATTIWYEMLPDGVLKKRTDEFCFNEGVSLTETETDPAPGDIELLGYIIENIDQRVSSITQGSK